MAVVDTKYSGLEIAIIGISGQFPGSDDCTSFWENLCQGKESIKTFSDEEVLQSGISADLLNSGAYIKSGSTLDHKNFFDHGFFEYRREEASLMDPQIRLLHEHCWKALEDAGCSSLIETKKIGLFVGATENTNWKLYVYSKAKEAAIDSFFLDKISNPNYISTLISYKLNLTGPSLYVSTACSTSLMAVNLACKSLLNRECSVAMAGGVSIGTSKQKGYLYEEGMIFSADGHCKAFDENASGTIAGEGVGVVVLKRLQDAIKDKDNIYAVIRSCVSNNDGKNKVGFTAPSVKGQSDCIKVAHKLAGIDPSSISYIEAHGTGTKLGDPIEVRALNLAFNTDGKEKFCALGSVKTNIGHLDVAAGVAGLIKTVLSLKNKKLPPSLNFTNPNPEIDFESGPFYVNTSLKEWKRKDDIPLRAGISSFGIGGTNVHMILEEAPTEVDMPEERPYKILTLSAKTASALDRYKDSLTAFLNHESNVDLENMSYTFQVGRQHFGYRKSIVFKDRQELLNVLNSEKAGDFKARNNTNHNSVVFMFSGQGSQYPGMGKDLYDSEKLFRKEMDKGFSIYKTLTGEDLKPIMFPESGATSDINETRYAQPIIFLFEYSLARLLMSWGVAPKCFIGHSIGEYVAACLSGVFTYEDALRIAVKRGQLMNSLAPGTMVSSSMKEEAAKKLLKDGISIAAVNSQDQVVFSGGIQEMDALMNRLSELNVMNVKLHTSHAFHSGMQDSIITDLQNELKNVQFSKVHIPFISNLTGKLITSEEAMSPDYWSKHMRETVRFSDGLKTILAQSGEKIFIEVGAGNSLTTLLKQQKFDKTLPPAINLVRHPKENENDMKFLTRQLGHAWTNGLSIDWKLYYEVPRRKVSLPTYSFEKIAYPTEVDPFEKEFAINFAPTSSTNNQKLSDWIYFPIWKNSVLISPPDENSSKTYLFFSIDTKFANSLRLNLSKKNNEVIEVYAGEEFKKCSNTKYAIHPNNKTHLEMLFAELKKNNFLFTDIIYSWGVGVDPIEIELSESNRAINLLYFSLAKITQVLLQNNNLSGKRISVITDCLHKLAGKEQINYAQSLALGLVNVLPQEYSVSCINIDINTKENAKRVVTSLTKEITNNSVDRIVALRDNERWIPDYQQFSNPMHKNGKSIRPNGIYLITGGLGNVGFVLSKYLIQTYNAKIVITGRRELKDITGHHTKATGEWSDRLNYLKSIGSEVRYFSMNVDDEEGFEKVVNEVENELGKLNGVIHAAGNIDRDNFQLIEDITYEKAFAIFAPKLKGIENVYKVFKDRKVDFVWITSSLASVLGGLSYATYSSANLYMDYFISSKAKESANWKCVGLGEMLFSEKQIQAENALSRSALKPEDIAELFEWSVSVNDRPVILETVANLQGRITKVYHEKKSVYLDNEFSVDTIEKHERPNLSNQYRAPESETERKLIEMVENFFGLANIGIEDNFFELGGDSLKAMVLLKRIKETFMVNITLKDFFDNQTIKQIAMDIDEKDWINKSSEKKFVAII